MGTQKDLLAGPMLDQHEASRVACVLEHGDAGAIRLNGLHRGNERTDLPSGGVGLARKRAIADDNDCSVHGDSGSGGPEGSPQAFFTNSDFSFIAPNPSILQSML